MSCAYQKMGGREDQTAAVAEKLAVQEAKKDRGATVTTTMPEKEVTLKDLARNMAGFAADREWDQFHSPRNLLLALVISLLPHDLSLCNQSSF